MRHAQPAHPFLRLRYILPLAAAVILALGVTFGLASPIKNLLFAGKGKNQNQSVKVDKGDRSASSEGAQGDELDENSSSLGDIIGLTDDADGGGEYIATADRSPFDRGLGPAIAGGATADVTSDILAGITADGSSPPEGASDVYAEASASQPDLLPVELASTSGPQVSVAANGQYEARDSGNNGLIVGLNNNAQVKVYYKGGMYTLKAGGQTFVLDRPIRFVAKQGTILSLPGYKDQNYNGSIKYNAFRGNIKVAYSKKSKGLWAVNELPIESYLKGIAEADSKAHEEYLKTMSVVTRSYALFYVIRGGKHKGEPFDLHNSRLKNGNDQVYAGYALEKQLPAIAKAIDATKGVVVTYDGKVAKTPFSAGTDGRTRSAAEVWGVTDLPYCKSVSDPYGKIANWKTLPGNHMVGLTGKGARGYAAAGKAYDFILKHYYTGIAVENVTPPRWIRIGIYKVAG